MSHPDPDLDHPGINPAGSPSVSPVAVSPAQAVLDPTNVGLDTAAQPTLDPVPNVVPATGREGGSALGFLPPPSSPSSSLSSSPFRPSSSPLTHSPSSSVSARPAIFPSIPPRPHGRTRVRGRIVTAPQIRPLSGLPDSSALAPSPARSPRFDAGTHSDVEVLAFCPDAVVSRLYNPKAHPPAASLPSPDDFSRTTVATGRFLLYRLLSSGTVFVSCSQFVHPVLPRSSWWKAGPFTILTSNPRGGFSKFDLTCHTLEDRRHVCRLKRVLSALLSPGQAPYPFRSEGGYTTHSIHHDDEDRNNTDAVVNDDYTYPFLPLSPTADSPRPSSSMSGSSSSAKPKRWLMKNGVWWPEGDDRPSSLIPREFYFHHPPMAAPALPSATHYPRVFSTSAVPRSISSVPSLRSAAAVSRIDTGLLSATPEGHPHHAPVSDRPRSFFDSRLSPLSPSPEFGSNVPSVGDRCLNSTSLSGRGSSPPPSSPISTLPLLSKAPHSLSSQPAPAELSPTSSPYQRRLSTVSSVGTAAAFPLSPVPELNTTPDSSSTAFTFTNSRPVTPFEGAGACSAKLELEKEGRSAGDGEDKKCQGKVFNEDRDADESDAEDGVVILEDRLDGVPDGAEIGLGLDARPGTLPTLYARSLEASSSKAHNSSAALSLSNSHPDPPPVLLDSAETNTSGSKHSAQASPHSSFHTSSLTFCTPASPSTSSLSTSLFCRAASILFAPPVHIFNLMVWIAERLAEGADYETLIVPEGQKGVAGYPWYLDDGASSGPGSEAGRKMRRRKEKKAVMVGAWPESCSSSSAGSTSSSEDGDRSVLDRGSEGNGGGEGIAPKVEFKSGMVETVSPVEKIDMWVSREE